MDRAVWDSTATNATFVPPRVSSGWIAEALEVYAYLVSGGPAMALSLSPLAPSPSYQSSTSSSRQLGAQDGGNLLLLNAFGYSEVTGITFALSRGSRVGRLGIGCCAWLFWEGGSGIQESRHTTQYGS